MLQKYSGGRYTFLESAFFVLLWQTEREEVAAGLISVKAKEKALLSATEPHISLIKRDTFWLLLLILGWK